MELNDRTLIFGTESQLMSQTPTNSFLMHKPRMTSVKKHKNLSKMKEKETQHEHRTSAKEFNISVNAFHDSVGEININPKVTNKDS
jgi:hypothetical protein